MSSGSTGGAIAHNKFKNGEYLDFIELKCMVDYICGNLNSWTPNYKYWYNQYSYSSKAFVVIEWRKKGDLNQWQNGERLFVKEIL